MVTYPKHGLRMAELWLDAPIVKPEGCDLLLLYQYREVPPAAVASPFSTLMLDLQVSEAALLQGLNRETKYQVRRAPTKAPVECIHEPLASDEVCHRFYAFYNEFAAAKGLAGLTLPPLLARSRGASLHFSRAVLGGATVVWHVHVVTWDRVALLYSASQFRNLDDSDARADVGRANRLLHWSDILAFKAQGKKVYDFGGWYTGTEDESLLRINQFKQGFGGTRVQQVNAGLALSWRGWLYLHLREHFSQSQRKAIRQKLLGLVGR